MPDRSSDAPTDRRGEVAANPGYAVGRLATALRTAAEHPDAETRARADERASGWLRVLKGMLAGGLAIGSRTPVDGVPAWATTRVLGGGFATGDLLAGGPLLDHERAWLRDLPGDTRKGRQRLFDHFLTEDGLRTLIQMLETGRYRIEVPEEGALLAVAWLATRGHEAAARGLVAELAPWADRLRFHPVPAADPPADPEAVRLASVADVLRRLDGAEAPADIRTQTETLTVWQPLEDRIVTLLLETVDGPVPTLVEARADGTSVVEGGWPFQAVPEGWRERARALVEEADELRRIHERAGRPDDPSRNLARLRSILAVAAEDLSALTGRQVGVVRATLAQIGARRGLPGSARHAALRAEQARVAALPTRADWAAVLAERLRASGAERGLRYDALGPLLAPVTAAEAEAHGLPAGAPMPDRYRLVLLRATEGTPEQHLAWGTLTSGESLARVVPGIAGHARSKAIEDPALRRLDAALYVAFRRRRSVLLLDLQSQVRLHELPWVAGLEPFRTGGASAEEAARATLERVVSLALTSFPDQILPNTLLQEIRALATAAGVRVPIADEIAADIFMGTFTEKYLRAAQHAARALRGTLYPRYYQIDDEALLALDDVDRPERGAPTSPGFAALCYARAGVSPPDRSRWRWPSVAENGAVIEQEQVLTTHNLAPLLDALDLPEVEARAAELAEQIFAAVALALRTLPADGRGRLRAVKNAAYAWRQMVVFLSRLSADDADAALGRMAASLTDADDPAARLLEDLRGVAAGTAGLGRRPFYGWARGDRPPPGG